MKQILVVGDDSGDNAALTDISRQHEYLITRTRNMNKALRIMKKKTPDYVICVGKIQQNEDGRYFLDI